MRSKVCRDPANRTPSNTGVDFTGISAPYEAPESPEIHIRTDQQSVEESVKAIVAYLQENQFI